MKGEVMRIVAAHLDGRRTAADIADMIRRPRSTVYAAVRRLGREADLGYIYRCKFSGGSHSVALRCEVNAWLVDQTPEGATPADLIAAIIEDAFQEAQA